MDADRVEVDVLTDACKKTGPKALYLNPTLQNPTTITISDRRRRDIATVERRFKLPIVDASRGVFVVDGLTT
jgi:DNA-binding transcriptional MocR family regulator